MTIDAGRSPERTDLAWQRTALAITAGAAIMARLRFHTLPTAGLLALLVSLLLSGWVFLVGANRHPGHHSVREGRHGLTGLALASAVALLAASELALLFVGSSSA